MSLIYSQTEWRYYVEHTHSVTATDHISDGKRGAKTFKPQFPHSITSIKILAFRQGNPGTLTVEVCEQTGFLPGDVTFGAPLASGTIDADTFVDLGDMEPGSPGEWETIDISPSDFDYEVGKTYGIIFSGTSQIPQVINYRHYTGEHLGISGVGRFYRYDSVGPTAGEWVTWQREYRGHEIHSQPVFEVYGKYIVEYDPEDPPDPPDPDDPAMYYDIDVLTHAPYFKRSNMIGMRGEIDSYHPMYVERWFSYREAGGEWYDTVKTLGGKGTFKKIAVGLRPGRTYEYIAKAGHRDFHEVFEGSTQTVHLPPGKPRNAWISARTSTSLTLEWDKGEGAEETRICRREDHLPPLPTADIVTTVSGNTYQDTGLSEDTRYYYTLWSCREGEFSLESACVSAVIGKTLAEDVLIDKVHVMVDWDDDGIYEDDIAGDMPRTSFQVGREHEIDEVRTGILYFPLHNIHERYTPTNSSSDLYPNVGVGKRIKVYVEYGLQGTEVYPLFTGRIVDLRVHPGYRDHYVTVSCADGVHDLKRRDVSMSAFHLGAKASDIVNEVLDKARWDGGREIPDDGAMIYGGGWKDISAWNIVQEVAKALRGMVYVNREGTLVFEGAYYRSKQPRTALSTFDNVQDITYGLSTRSVFNEIRVHYSEWEVARTSSVVASYVHPGLRPDTSFEVELDWEKNIASIGSINAWGEWWYHGEAPPRHYVLPVDVEVLEETPKSVTVRVTYPDPQLTDIYMHIPYAEVFVEVRAFEVTETPCSKTVRDDDSIDKYGLRSLLVNLRLSTAGYDEVQMLADALLEWHKDPHPDVTVGLRHPDYTEAMLERDISDRVTITSSSLGISNDYFIDSVEYTIARRRLHSAKWRLSDPQMFWMLGVDRLGETTRLAI